MVTFDTLLNNYENNNNTQSMTTKHRKPTWSPINQETHTFQCIHMYT